MTLKKLIVKQPEIDPVPTEVMADEIIAMAQGIRKLRSGRLNDRALILLIQDAASTQKLGRTTIKAVLDGIEGLEREFLRKKQP